MTSSATPQPNVTELKISLGFWIVIVSTGAGAGFAGALLMKLLRFTQHLCYSYNSGDFLRSWTRLASEGSIGQSRSQAICNLFA